MNKENRVHVIHSVAYCFWSLHLFVDNSDGVVVEACVKISCRSDAAIGPHDRRRPHSTTAGGHCCISRLLCG